MAPDTHGWGTIPYHQKAARRWRRGQLVWLANLAGQCVIAALTVRWWWLVPLWVCLGFVSGAGFMNSRTWRERHLSEAWKIETEQTLTLMVRSGLFETPDDAFESIRNGPPPPGISVRKWKRMMDSQRD